MYYDKGNENATDILARYSSYLDDDLEAQQDGGAKSNAAKKRNSRKQFAAYLISVATHSIGLRASISPFNCNQEQVLVYIMELFRLKETQLEKILAGGQQNKGKESNKPFPRKRHSWRPELRLRISPPTYLYDKDGKLEDLSIRVHLFKDPKVITEEKQQQPASPGPKEAAQSKGLMKIFKKFQLDASVLIRPSSESKFLIRFVKFNQIEPYKMVYTKQGGDVGDKIIDDIHLSIRRYYCEPNSAHILRLEFWSDSTNMNSTRFDGLKRFARYYVLGGCLRQYDLRDSAKAKGQRFYGYINIKLTSVPSYAIRKTYPVMTLKELRVNNCELCLEIRNRRIMDVDDRIDNQEIEKDQTNQSTVEIEVPKPKAKKSGDFFISNHLRLYANCLLYQTLSLSEEACFKIGNQQTMITLDNLLYFPAYTLINQHRLQSNLNQLEDQSLRRTCILELLLKLNQQNVDQQSMEQQNEKKTIDFRLEYTKYILISVLQNEYVTAHRPMDDKTFQEADPFREDPIQDSSRDLIVDLECIALKDFMGTFMSKHLRKCFIRSQSERQAVEFDIERSVTLIALRLCSFIIAHLQKSGYVRFKLKAQANEMKKMVEKTLVDIILKKVKSRLNKIIKQDKNMPRGQKTTKGLRARRKLSSTSPWRMLLFDIRLINNDLCLYWSRKGLHGLDTQQRVADNSSLSSMLYQEDLKNIITEKINDYLGIK